MAKQQLINRAKYKDIKRYDHSQMERFARSLYESGFKDGAVQATATDRLTLTCETRDFLPLRG